MQNGILIKNDHSHRRPILCLYLLDFTCFLYGLCAAHAVWLMNMKGFGMTGVRLEHAVLYYPCFAGLEKNIK